MSFKYIGRALAAINRIDAVRGDWAAYRIGRMTQADISTLDSNLDAGWLAVNMRNVATHGSTRGEVADWRRGAQLMQRLTGVAPTASFDEGAAKTAIRTANIGMHPLPPGGYYLKASTWAFATRGERTQLEQAWADAAVAIQWGILIAQRARAGAGAARTLYLKWFALADALAVEATLATVQNGIAANLIGVCYQGNGIADGNGWPIKLRELSNSNQATEVSIGSGWGWSAPVISMHHAIGFCPDFFNQNSKLRMTRAHNVTSREMSVTRYGAMVHELTHRLAATRDVDVPNAVYTHLGRPLPAPNARAKGYGPFTCAGLAAAAPADALVNADNYRLFCEDAVYAKPLA